MDARSVPHQQQALVARVPQGDSKLAVQAPGKIVAPLLVGMHDDFGIGCRGETMTGGTQFIAQFHVIEDFAVEDHPNVAILVGHRLTAAGDVDDRQAGMAERHVFVHVRPGFIGTTVMQPGNHAPQPFRIPLQIVNRAEARQTTHVLLSPRCAARPSRHESMAGDSTAFPPCQPHGYS